MRSLRLAKSPLLGTDLVPSREHFSPTVGIVRKTDTKLPISAKNYLKNSIPRTITFPIYTPSLHHSSRYCLYLFHLFSLRSISETANASWEK